MVIGGILCTPWRLAINANANAKAQERSNISELSKNSCKHITFLSVFLKNVFWTILSFICINKFNIFEMT